MRRADDRQASSAIGRNVITSPHHGPSGMQATRAVRHAYRGPSGMQDKICRFSRRRLDGNDLPASRHEKQSGRLAASARTTKANPSGRPACKLTHVANGAAADGDRAGRPACRPVQGDKT